MKPLCRTALALGTAGFLSVGTLTGVGLPSSIMATAHAAETCSGEGFVRVTEGHQDMAMKDEGGNISFVVKDDQKDEEYRSEEFAVEVAEKNKQHLSDLEIPSLPDEGWVLPQTQIEDVPWLGFNTQELSEEYLGSKQTATLSMAIASGPEDGRIVAFQNEGIGDLKVRMDTKDGTAWNYPGKFHAHLAFAFTKPGTYAVSFTFELPDGSRHYLHAGFLVGDDADAAELCGVDYDESDDAEVSVPSDGTSRPNQPAKDIKGVDKAIAGDKKKEKDCKDQSGDTPAKQGQSSGSGGSGGKAAEKNSGSKQGANQGSKPGSQSGSTKGSARGSGQNKTNQAHGSGAGSGAASRNSGGGSSKGTSASSGSHSGSKAAHSTSGGSSGQKSAGKSSPQSKSNKSKDSKSKEAKSEKHSSAPAPNASVGGKNENDEALAGAAYTASLAMSSFWAGILAGLGAFALVLGIGLLIYVQFFRKKKLAGEQTEHPEQPGPPQADDATTQIPRVD